MRMWVLARPLSGLETFSQSIVELIPGRQRVPETDASAQAVLFVVSGSIT